MGIKDTSVFKRLRNFLNPAIKGKMTNGVLAGLAVGDHYNAENTILMKDQLFIATATDSYLKNLLSGIGVTKPIGVGIDDESFRQLAIIQTNTKLVTNVFLEVLQVFYGPDAVKASAISTKPEGYKLEDGMTLIIQVDNNPSPLTVTFTTKDFTSINHATADEISSVISRFAFNSAYPIISIAEIDRVLGLKYVKVQSLTKGPKSAITILGGSAQNVLQFPDLSQAQSKYGTEYAISFIGQYVRFTWVAGADPGLQFLNVGDIVNIYGSSVLENNRGTFTIANAQGGTVTNAFFEITNPIFQAQANIICNPADTVSGDGTVKSIANITSSPTGIIRSGNVVTVNTLLPHNFAAGNIVTISSTENTTFFGSFTIQTTPTANSFTYNQIGLDSASGSGLAEVSFTISAEPNGAIRLSGVSTIQTTSNHPFITGQQVTISNVRDSSFDGVYTITGTTANTFTYTQDFSNEITFFKSKRNTLSTLARYATVYEANPYEITVFLPVTTKVVKRDLIGSWHIHASATDRSFPGSYIYSPTELSITKNGTKLNETVANGSIKTVVQMQDTTSFPDGEGYLMFNFGESNQEGPVRYLSRPSSNSLLIDASYKFKNDHSAGSSVYLLQDTNPIIPAIDGSSRQAFLTGTATGRLEAEKLIEKLKASGIFLNIVLVVPDGPGLHDMRYVYDIGSTETIY